MDWDILDGIRLITVKYSADICGFRNIDLTDFYDPETFSLVLSLVCWDWVKKVDRKHCIQSHDDA